MQLRAGIRPVPVRFGAVLVSAAVSLVATSVSSAAADTIFMKNGREIRTSEVILDGDRVLFTQFGYPIAIPMSEVARIVEDEYQDPEPRPLPADTADQALPATDTGDRDAASPVDADIPPEQTREFWEDSVRSIEAERILLEQQLLNLRRTERALFLGLYRDDHIRPQIDEVLRRIEANKRALPELRREARRLGVPAGWLRVSSRSG